MPRLITPSPTVTGHRGGCSPEELGECWLERLLERWGGGCGGEPPAERGLPGGSVSATDMSAAIGEGPPAGGEAAARPRGEPPAPLLSAALVAPPTPPTPPTLLHRVAVVAGSAACIGTDSESQ
ncbi:hypothetical protein RR48_08791 [Papilio machaon]|uniref:Uncharacterized protein n=1 Tax=Papilio machaon TaxID=76193 RepID=A0A194RIY5_PAPMA|nr:hypothetical protein RR48_08791 [Papilio machaon]